MQLQSYRDEAYFSWQGFLKDGRSSGCRKITVEVFNIFLVNVAFFSVPKGGYFFDALTTIEEDDN